MMAIGHQVFNRGEYGHGTRTKLITNLLVAIHNVASGEAIALAKRAGLDARRVVEVIGASAATSRIFELRGPLMADNRYEPATMRLSTWQKDMTAIAAFAASLDFPTPLLNATVPLYRAAMAANRGHQDTAAVCAVLEAMTQSQSCDVLGDDALVEAPAR
jgi:L-threonate 2-dehydrogenase